MTDMGRLQDNNTRFWKASDVVDKAKMSFGIEKPNSQMSDHEIRRVIRWVGDNAPDTVWVNRFGEESILQGIGLQTVLGKEGIGMMLTITLLVFPRFYERFELSQFN
jgi:hypothetical protein